MIAQRLDQKLREQTAVGGVFNSCAYLSRSHFLSFLFPIVVPFLSFVSFLFVATLASSSFQRPLLIVIDRNEDLSAILAHSWTYQALVHDLFALDLNRVQIDIKVRR